MSDQFVYVVDSGLIAISIPEIERAFDNSPRTTIAALVLVLPMFPAENIAVVIGLPPQHWDAWHPNGRPSDSTRGDGGSRGLAFDSDMCAPP